MRVFLGWLGLIPLMIGNGVLRQSVYGPSFSELTAHQISTVSGVVILAVYTLVIFPRLRVLTSADAWRTGLLWAGLTIAFEFSFGHFVVGHSWGRLLQDYNLLAGRVWSFFLLAMLVLPRLALLLRDRRADTT